MSFKNKQYCQLEIEIIVQIFAQQIYLENSFTICHTSHVCTYSWYAGVCYLYIQKLRVHDSPEETLQSNCD